MEYRRKSTRPGIRQRAAAAEAPPDHSTATERRLGAANEGARSLKALFFWYVGALAYAIISVAGITDEQLLKESPLKLPILNVDIPLREYLAILPMVVFLIHLELLVQFALLSNKVNHFEAGLRHLPAAAANEFRLRLENFMLLHLLAGRHNAVLRCLLFILMYAALVAFPLTALLAVQWQVLAYRDETFVIWHRILVGCDVAALLYFWPNLFHTSDMSAGNWARLILFRILPRVLTLYAAIAGVFVAVTVLSGDPRKALIVAGLAAAGAIIVTLAWPSVEQAMPSAPRVRRFAKKWPLKGTLYPATYISIAAGDIALIRAFPDASAAWWLGHASVLAVCGIAIADVFWTRHRNHIGWARQKLTRIRARTRQAGRYDAPGISAFGILCVIAIIMSWFAPPRSLELNGAVLTAHELSPDLKQRLRASDFVAIGQIDPIDLQERDLSDSQLEGAVLPRALMGGVRLERAYLYQIKLVGADLKSARLSGASLGRAKLLGGSMEFAQLEGALLDFAEMNGALLERTQLQGADLQEAQLAGSILDTAQLQSAAMSGTQLQGAMLDNADLQAAILYKANLRGADFKDTILNQTIFILPVTGPLMRSDEQLLPDAPGLGNLYDERRRSFLQHVAQGTATTWSSDKQPCLLIANPGMPAPPPCEFMAVLDESGAYPALSPSSNPELQQLWSGYAYTAAAVLCQAPPLQSFGIGRFDYGLWYALEFFRNNAEIRTAITQAAVQVLAEPGCRLRWPRIEIERELGTLAPDSPPAALLQAWLQELDMRGPLSSGSDSDEQ